MKPTHDTDLRPLAGLDPTQIDPRVLEQMARHERALALAAAVATGLAWAIRLPRRLAEAARNRLATGRHA